MLKSLHINIEGLGLIFNRELISGVIQLSSPFSDHFAIFQTKNKCVFDSLRKQISKKSHREPFMIEKLDFYHLFIYVCKVPNTPVLVFAREQDQGSRSAKFGYVMGQS